MMISDVRKGGAVKRFHTVRTIGEQTVAEHSWGVAVYVLHLWPDASPELVKAALLHDVAEYSTGDIPAPTKWRHPDFAKALKNEEEETNTLLGIRYTLSEEDQRKLNAVDMLELVYFCVDQRWLGNVGVQQTILNGYGFIKENFGDMPEVISEVMRLMRVYESPRSM